MNVIKCSWKIHELNKNSHRWTRILHRLKSKRGNRSGSHPKCSDRVGLARGAESGDGALLLDSCPPFSMSIATVNLWPQHEQSRMMSSNAQAPSRIPDREGCRIAYNQFRAICTLSPNPHEEPSHQPITEGTPQSQTQRIRQNDHASYRYPGQAYFAHGESSWRNGAH